MNNNNEDVIVNPTNKEVVTHPEHVEDAIKELNLSHPEYDD